MKNMNIIVKFLIVLFTCTFVFLGCEDFLTTQPADNYTQKNFWQTKEQVQAGLTSVYEVLRGYPADMILYSSQLTPNAVRFDDPGGWRAIARGEALATNDLFLRAWQSNYRGIGRANTVITNAEKANIDETAKKQIIAEAKFLRAFFYADLINKFGAVPLILAPPHPSQGDKKRTKKGKVLSQILEDLTEAAKVLPIENEPGRPTKSAALALKARILLYNSMWAKAAEAAKEVMELDVYSLYPDYEGIFTLQNEHNSEVIWNIEFKMPRFGHAFDAAAVTHAHPAPLRELVTAYYMKDGKSANKSPLFDPEHPYKTRDPRLYKTITLLGSMYNGSIIKPNDVPETGFGVEKYTTYPDSTQIPHISGGQSEINPIVIRYAGVLLIYAEAMNEADGPTQAVYNAINKIRQRVDMPKVEPGLSQDEMRQVIHHERRIELAMEGLYYADIIRWGIALEVMNGPVHDASGNVYEYRTFAPKDTLWAIPNLAIDRNPNLKQNPGW